MALPTNIYPYILGGILSCWQQIPEVVVWIVGLKTDQDNYGYAYLSYAKPMNLYLFVIDRAFSNFEFRTSNPNNLYFKPR